MVKAQRSPSSCLRELRRAVVVCAGAAGIVLAMPLQAASFGHARLASAPGQPLGIDIPVSQLAAEDAVGLRVVPAPEAQWTQAGLVPPVPLASIRGQLLPGPVSGSLRLHVSSAEIFNQPIADLLLDVHTASGVHRYQVSVLARDGGASLRVPEADSGADVAGQAGRGDVLASSAGQPVIRVRKGDTMFAIARRHAVQGVSVYQMMIALQRANPQAFIENNLNLVRAGAELRMPDRSALTAISDREARRLFHEQVVAFQRYREGRRGQPEPAPEIAPVIEAAEVPEAEPAAAEEAPVVSNIPPEQVGGGDRLRLSSGRVAPSATTSAQQETPVAGALFNQSAQSAQSAVAELGNSVAQNLAAGISRDAHAANAVPGDPAPAASAVSATPADGKAPAPAAGAAAASGAPVAASFGNAGRRIAAPGVSAEGADERTGDPVSTAAATAVAAAEAARAASGEVTPAETADEPAPAAATPTVATPTAATPAAAAPAAATDDGTADDDRVALEKEMQDARDRVSLLEENVRNLNKALQSQGEAAKDLVVDGAIGLRQSLTEMATAVTEATIGEEPEDDDTAEKAAAAGKPLTTPSTSPAASGEASETASGSPTVPSPVAGAAAPDAAPATASSSETASPATAAPATDTPVPATDKPGPAASAAPAASPAPATVSPSATGQASRSPLLREWLLPGMAGIIGLLLLVIVWLLRRATRMRGQAPDHVTPEMVKERLEGISLDLDDDPRR